MEKWVRFNIRMDDWRQALGHMSALCATWVIKNVDTDTFEEEDIVFVQCSLPAKEVTKFMHQANPATRLILSLASEDWEEFIPSDDDPDDPDDGEEVTDTVSEPQVSQVCRFIPKLAA